MKKMYTENIEIVKKLKQIAIKKGASDIFLSSGSIPAYRLHGETIFFENIEIIQKEILEEYLHVMLTDSEKQRFEGKMEFDFSICSGEKDRFRINVFKKLGGMSIVFRHIPEAIPTMKSLGLPESLKQILNLKNGLVLFTGAMGSGKSTSLASLINTINKEQKKHIVTIEDPVEFIYKNEKSLIEQRELNVHTSDYHNALKSSLRQAADVILVGELRDLETISWALTAAETGALVFATLHTNGSAKAIDRLIDAFPGEAQNQIRAQLSTTLKCIVWQTLLSCEKREGRIPAFEVLFHNYAVGTMIREKKVHQIPNLLEMCQAEGMINMMQSLTWLLENKMISLETAQRTLPERANDLAELME